MIAATVAAGIGGAIWAGLAGGLKAYRGAHEVITTIMLNWIAIYTTQYLFAVSGPLTDNSVGNGVSKTSRPRRSTPACGASCSRSTSASSWRSRCAVVYYVILNRTTLGYEVRAVGLNPEAARYGGISVKRSMIASMAICGAFAGLAGAVQVLGVNYSIASSDVPVLDIGFTGIAVALLGRNTAIGVVLAALLFAALQSGGAPALGLVQPRARERRLEHHPGHDHPARRRRAARALAGRARQARARRAADDDGAARHRRLQRPPPPGTRAAMTRRTQIGLGGVRRLRAARS